MADAASRSMRSHAAYPIAVSHRRFLGEDEAGLRVSECGNCQVGHVPADRGEADAVRRREPTVDGQLWREPRSR